MNFTGFYSDLLFVGVANDPDFEADDDSADDVDGVRQEDEDDIKEVELCEDEDEVSGAMGRVEEEPTVVEDSGSGPTRISSPPSSPAWDDIVEAVKVEVETGDFLILVLELPD